MKHKLLVIWVIAIFAVAVLAAINQLTYGPQSLYNAFLTTDVVIVMLGCPIIFIDARLASGYSKKKGVGKYQDNYQEKDTQLRLKELELEKKTIELERKDLVIERKNIEIREKSSEVLQKFCPNCGKRIDSEASICTYCGVDLEE